MNITQRDGLSNNFINSILEDSYGNLWFGTYGGGVSIFDGESFTHITQKEGLIDNWVNSILKDNNNNIWLGTPKGLNCLVFEQDSISTTNATTSAFNPVIHTYTLQDGLKCMFFNKRCALLDSKNHIWWGTSNCLTTLDMNNFKIPVEAPVMQLNQLDISGQFTDYRHLEDANGIEIELGGIAKFYNISIKPGTATQP